MTGTLSAVTCPKCGGDCRLIDRTPRSGPYPEMLTLKCVSCHNIFTTPENPERNLPKLPRGHRDFALLAAPLFAGA